MKYYLIVFLLLSVTACHDAKHEKVVGTLTKEENFSEFFEKFKSDSSFQVSRIQFPLNAWSYAEDPESPIGLGDSLIIHHTFTLQDYTFFTFEENTEQEYDKYTVETFSEGNTATVTLSGVDNGISVEYQFSIINGLWHMVKIVDQST